MRLFLAALLFSLTGVPALAESVPCDQGVVWEDLNGNGRIDPGEKPLAGIKLSDGVRLVSTDAQGRYRLPFVEGRTVFVIKPASHVLPMRADGLPDFWIHTRATPGPTLKFGGIPVGTATCRDFGLRVAKPSGPPSLNRNTQSRTI